jgi:hypothetical protein
VSSAFTFAAQGQTAQFVEASATLSATATVTATGYRIVGPVEPYQFDDYIWDNEYAWADWTQNVWGPDGFTARSRVSITPNAGLLFTTGADLDTVAAVVPDQSGVNGVFGVERGTTDQQNLAITAEITPNGGYLILAAADLAANFTATPNGGLFLGATATIDAEFATTPDADLRLAGRAVLNTTAGIITDQTGVNGAFGVIRGIGDNQSLITTATITGDPDMIYDSVVTLSAFYSEVVAIILKPQDPDRTIAVGREPRTIHVLEESRVMKVEPELRTIRVIVMPKIGTTNRRELV